MQSPGPDPPVCCSLQHPISQSQLPESNPNGQQLQHLGLMTPKTRLYVPPEDHLVE